jgi:HEAT repeat protein
MEHDSNVGNRLAALDAVRGMEGGDDLQRSLIEVLEHDKNMGVRVESVDVLVDHLEKEGRDEAVLGALQRLATNDPNRYVRLKCESALRRLGSNGF